VFDETVEFNEQHKSHALRDSWIPPGESSSELNGFPCRIDGVAKTQPDDEVALGASCITDWLSPEFFETEFWFMWATTFAFQPWHSAVEFKRYLHRFMLEFSRIETLAGVKRTIYNQYDSMVVPLQTWLKAQGVRFLSDCKVTSSSTRRRAGSL